jgi:hypothetical protein
VADKVVLERVVYRHWAACPVNTAAILQTTRRESLQAAWRRYGIVCAGLALSIFIMLIALSPWVYETAVLRFLLPTYEAEFGFHGGWIRPEGFEYSIYGVAYVTYGGRLVRAGVKSGDIPEYGAASFYEALVEATEGRRGRFTVVSVARGSASRQEAREIWVFPK